MAQTRQPRGRRGPSKGDLREAAILDTARQLVAERPIASITVDQLAGGAGLSRSTFYFYFESRDAVFYTLATDSLAELGGILGEFESTTPARAAIRQAVVRYLERWRVHGPLLRALSDHELQLHEPWQTVHTRAADSISALIEAERAADRAPGGPDARDLAVAFLAMMWRAGYEFSVEQPTGDAAIRKVDTLTTVFVRSIWCTPD
ncbi:TetR/AcrR family transcriptional regulator [Nocardia sp. NPDC058176]|uniref:TetR/AcrR family transcriptional regulator n=1 Tax=Nocardia sp. NPDC058176 TaxID=3346368 RepID=UPI0036DAC9D4